jgi:hypothetical protein
VLWLPRQSRLMVCSKPWTGCGARDGAGECEVVTESLVRYAVVSWPAEVVVDGCDGRHMTGARLLDLSSYAVWKLYGGSRRPVASYENVYHTTWRAVETFRSIGLWAGRCRAVHPTPIVRRDHSGRCDLRTVPN